MDYDKISVKFNECLNTITNEIIEPSQNRPVALYHYTNANGMLGIIDSNRLWATHYQYLNDLSELEYGYSLAKKIIKSFFDKEENDIVKTFLGHSLDSCTASSSGLEFYITCFCEHDDVLNQWRVYTGTSQGYALGFDASSIGRRNAENENQDFILRKVIYDEVKQCELISKAIRLISDKLKTLEFEGSRENSVDAACEALKIALIEMAVTFKHPAYSVEHEWRALHASSPLKKPDLKFREGAYGLTPYITLDISASAGVNAHRLPLRTITTAPSQNTHNSYLALKKLIEVKRIAHCHVIQSSLPVRT